MKELISPLSARHIEGALRHLGPPRVPPTCVLAPRQAVVPENEWYLNLWYLKMDHRCRVPPVVGDHLW